MGDRDRAGIWSCRLVPELAPHQLSWCYVVQRWVWDWGLFFWGCCRLQGPLVSAHPASLSQIPLQLTAVTYGSGPLTEVGSFC